MRIRRVHLGRTWEGQGGIEQACGESHRPSHCSARVPEALPLSHVVQALECSRELTHTHAGGGSLFRRLI